jgi:hypothetical protein
MLALGALVHLTINNELNQVSENAKSLSARPNINLRGTCVHSAASFAMLI